MRMNRPRTPPAPVLPDLTGPIEASPWRWSGAEPEASVRLALPPAARRALVGEADGAVEVAGVVRGDTLVLLTNQPAPTAPTGGFRRQVR